MIQTQSSQTGPLYWPPCLPLSQTFQSSRRSPTINTDTEALQCVSNTFIQMFQSNPKVSIWIPLKGRTLECNSNPSNTLSMNTVKNQLAVNI